MPNSIFNGNPTYLPPINWGLTGYTPPAQGIQASAGQTPYDRWLYSQNSRLGNLGLPSYTDMYAATNPNYAHANTPPIAPVGVAPGSNGVYNTNPYQPPTETVTPPWVNPVAIPTPTPVTWDNTWPGPTYDPTAPTPLPWVDPHVPSPTDPLPLPTPTPAPTPQPPIPDNEGPPRLPPLIPPQQPIAPPSTPEPTYQPPAPEPTYQPPQTAEVVVGPYSNTPQSAEETARLAIRAQLQGLVASGDQEAALNYMNQNGITSGQFEEMLAYNGSPITSGSPYGWLANASQNTGIPVAGLTYASPEEVDQFISWQQNTPNSMTNQTGAELTAAQGITDPYSNATIRDNALQTIRTQSGLQSIRNANGNDWTPEYQSYTPQSAPQPSPLTQVQSSVNTVGPAPIVQESQQPQYQQVAGSFVNQDTGDIVTYDSNGAHTSTGRIDPSWLAAHQPAPVQQPTQQQVDRWDLHSDNRARGGLIKLSQKYASGGGVNALAGKYNLY